MRGERRNRTGCLWLVLTVIHLLGFSGMAQPPGRYRLSTDRGIYVAGEAIQFRVFNLNPPVIREQGWSTVYYLELISPAGTSLERTKWPLDGEGTAGSLPVPKDIPSGTYFLKGYTKWMKNGTPRDFQYLSMEIINPYRKDLLRVDTSSGSDVDLQERGSCSGVGGPVIIPPERTYSPGEQVSLELESSVTGTSLNCCVSVVWQGAFSTQMESPGSSGTPADEGKILPETQGITLSGSVWRDTSGTPAPYAIVYLSSLGSGNEFYATYSDAEGRFYFALSDGVGEKEYFISSSLGGRTDLTLRLDQDFSTGQVTLPSFPLRSVQADPDLVTRLAINAQISDQYRESLPQAQPDSGGNGVWFYGEPEVIIRFRDYIQLPDLEEYFSEVIPQVNLRRSGGNRSLQVRGDHPDMQYFQPLVLVDGVAVFDVESVLGISPRAVDRVEIVTAPYIRGNVTFGGIVHLITRTGNMGYMDLPASGLLLKYQKFSGGTVDDLAGRSSGPGTPDVRNTIFWRPDVLLTPGEVRTFGFQAPDVAGNYEIRIVGYGPGGNCHEERQVIRVE